MRGLSIHQGNGMNVQMKEKAFQRDTPSGGPDFSPGPFDHHANFDTEPSLEIFGKTG